MSPEQLFTRFKLTLTTLTPLHVGSGAKLREGFDFVVYDRRLWVVHISRLMRAMLPAAVKDGQELAAAARQLAGVSLGEMVQNGWLLPEDFSPQSPFFKYSLAGEIPAGNELNECIKDVYHHPYLPGSTLKGAFRSVLLRHNAQAGPDKLPGVNFDRDKFAAQPVESEYFVPNWKGRKNKSPNYNLWRACRVGDSILFPQSSLSLIQADTISLKDTTTSIPLYFEGLPQGSTTSASFAVEDWLFHFDRWLRPEDKRVASRRLYFKKGEYDQFVSGLASIVNRQARHLLQEEQKYYQTFQKRRPPGAGAQDVSNALRWLEDTLAALDGLGSRQMILPVGRGTGWRSKTLGAVLLDPQKLPQEDFQRIVNRFKLGKGQWLKHPLIPLTRMLASCGGQNRVPPGWVKINLELEA